MSPREIFANWEQVVKHPAFIDVLQANSRFFNSLEAATLANKTKGRIRSQRAFAYLEWLAQKLIDNNTGTKTKIILPFLLRAVFGKENAALPQAKVPVPDNPNWQKGQGPDYWCRIVRPAFQAVIARYHHHQNGKEIGELFAGKRWQSTQLAGKAIVDCLRYCARDMMVQAWNVYNKAAQERATDTRFFNNQKPNDLQKKANDSRRQRDRLKILLTNPWCSRWFADVVAQNSPQSLESSVWLAWVCRRDNCDLPAPALYQALTANSKGSWHQLITSAAGQELAAVNDFVFWENLRGRWHNKVMPQIAQQLPIPNPETLTSDVPVVLTLWQKLQAWRAKPRGQMSQQEQTALAAFCWLGCPTDRLQPLKTALKNAGQDKFIEACRIQLALTAILHGASFQGWFKHQDLLGANRLAEVPKLVGDLYQTRRPFCIRTAADLCWAFARYVAVANPSGLLTRDALSAIDQLNPLIGKACNNKKQGGLPLALSAVRLELADNQFTRSLDWCVFPQCASIGKGIWELTYWITLWDLQIKNTHDKHLLSIQPISDWGNICKELRPQLAGVLVYLNRESRVAPRAICPVFLRRDKKPIGGKADDNWQSLALWNAHINASVKIPVAKNQAKMNQSLLPWACLAEHPLDLLRLLVAQAAQLEQPLQSLSEKQLQTISKVQSPSDIDGLTANYLPENNWAYLSSEFGKETEKIGELEDKINNQLNHSQMLQAIEALKPLLDAPLVLNIADFREQMQAAIADVREAESLLAATRHASLAAEMEWLAKTLLNDVNKLEIKRTDILLQIQDNEIERRKLASVIAEKQIKIGQLKQQKARAEKKYQQKRAALVQQGAAKAQQIRDLEIQHTEFLKKNTQECIEIQSQRADLQVKNAEIEVELAVKAIMALQNQIKLIQDMICNPTHHPNPQKFSDSKLNYIQDDPAFAKVKELTKDVKTKQFPGQLGALAFDARVQVNIQIASISKKIGELQDKLDKLREGACIKGICQFIGGIVGSIIGGPFGAKLGMLIGGAVGELVTGVIQKKPWGEILVGLADDALEIAKVSGLDIQAQLNNFGDKLGGQLGKALGDLEKNLGPILKDMPAFISQDSIKDAMKIAGVDGPLQTIFTKSSDILTDLKAGAANVQLGDMFVGGVQKMAFSGNPKDMLDTMKNKLKANFANIEMDLKDWQKAAQDLGENVKNLDAKTIKARIASHVGNVVMAKVSGKMGQFREHLLMKAMSAMPVLQETLQQGKFNQIGQAIQQTVDKFGESLANNAKGIVGQEKQQIRQMLSGLFKNVAIKPNQALDWNTMQIQLEKMIQDMYPQNPEKRGFMMGQFQLQLDKKGLQAKVQNLMKEWNGALQMRMQKVEEHLAQTYRRRGGKRTVAKPDQASKNRESNAGE